MQLVVGLGNPGSKYAGTRHNVGFEVLNELARRVKFTGKKDKFQGEIAEIVLGQKPVMLLWPMTFMNLSGASVLAVRDFYKVANEDILVVCDDFSIPLGKLRIRTKGSSGGQKGLENIQHRLGTDEIPRLRFGIGPIPEGWDAVGFVLGKFAKEELEAVDETRAKCADAVEAWVEKGIATCMNQFNS